MHPRSPDIAASGDRLHANVGRVQIAAGSDLDLQRGAAAVTVYGCFSDIRI